ncbi:UBX domain-containing protein 6 [Cephus cinctus]|uniref:UBX domain-containing protein 6 n=1 Tax=Cephus cinctus TaxID=211228 RepID=A0AAJ7BG85_CEPCN|nr:UBX domain-containing protein 6 [Cephus cinctus]XP_015585214.1 UBX domain-containing protein 6 [Cephus cinctus]XP_024936085.1 UBX domain-containing protein 6 [Cephus cinctus]
MAEKIKNFFLKKKHDVKFKKAGKGYRLNETSSNTASSSSSQNVKPIKRAEPTQEAKVAGQAALARLESKRPDPTKFNTSYAAIQARVKRELEAERKALSETNAIDKIIERKDEKVQDVIEDNPFLAVKGVYFRCPMISDEILPRDEWKKKIREFLYDQLQDQEAGLTACLIIHSCNSGKEKIENCIETLGKYLENIITNPGETKYWKIRMCNRVFKEKVKPLEGALDLLRAAGFEEKRILHQGEEEDFLVWNPEKSTIDNVTMLIDALNTAEPIQLELDRNVQVLLPSEATKRNELPPVFFTITPEEIKREQQLRAEAVAQSQILRTKAMREKEELREMKKYRFALIRIRFPDNIILQGTFAVFEKFENVMEFIKENLISDEIPFSLILPSGQKVSNEDIEKTLIDLRLVPASVLKFSWNIEGFEAAEVVGYLKEEVLSLIQSL